MTKSSPIEIPTYILCYIDISFKASIMNYFGYYKELHKHIRKKR